ncbi:hypothetical protein AMATHDRAFT_145525 [Amanita thiersii Skay4041]|uniref:F-box domain-containing protein n=1 Tax=Amanita thiersii Skay4041 TaxID=703135 RepID=A0A2A9NR94_9AGAR|nr:hypothetical protein AMATHDRAFT_145525 [Amanita thiersii Skay4041]
MNSLPHTVWDYIIQFIPALCLKDMISVNSYFFNIAMDYRYRQVSLTYLNTRMLKTLVRLSDPAVAHRVRTVYIYPDFLKEDLFETPNALQRMIRRGGRNLSNPGGLEKLFSKSGKCHLPVDVLVEWIQDVFSGLQNVIDYHITWFGLPALSRNPGPLMTALFGTAHIRRLTLTISFTNIPALHVPGFSELYHLEELQILVHNDNNNNHNSPKPVLRPDDAMLILSQLADVINNTRGTLRILSIGSWGPVQLGHLLQYIDVLPRLEKLFISLPLDTRFLGDPASLEQFLNHKCSTLRVLGLRAEQNAGDVTMAAVDPYKLAGWFQEALQDVSLSKLRSLEISGMHLPPEVCVEIVSTFGRTLKSLTLTGLERSTEYIEEVVDVLSASVSSSRLTSQCEASSRGLERLRLSFVTLTPKLVDLLAERLPELKELTLHVKDIVPSSRSRRGAALRKIHGYTIASQYEDQMEAFFSEMETRQYSKWKLQDLNIVLSSIPDAEFWQPYLEHLFAECVPSIARSQ